MSKSYRWEKIEAQYGLPMREILTSLYREHGTKTAVAAVLDVPYETMQMWWMRCGLPDLLPRRHYQSLGEAT